MRHSRLATAFFTLAALLVAMFFIAGVILGAAAYNAGTSLGHSAPVQWSRLPTEFVQARPVEIARHFPYLRAPMFVGLLWLAIAVRTSRGTSIVWRNNGAFLGAILIITALPAAVGGVAFVFTLLNAFFWLGLHGEYFNEFWPVDVGFFFAHALACASVLTSLPRPRVALPNSVLLRPSR